MAKNHISQQDPTAGNNTDIGGISIDEGAMAMSSINNAFREQSSQLADFYDDLGGAGTVGGTADAITLTSQMPALATGNLIRFVAGANNTGATTINVNGLGVKAIRKISGGADVALAADDIREAEYQLIIYDAAANSAAGAWMLIANGGMSQDVYDPNGVGDDAFDMDNMVEGTDTKVMTAAERTAISGLATTYQPLDSDLTTIAAANNGSVLAATTASFLTADETKLDNIEALADVTDETNVVSALNGATLPTATVSGSDKLLLQDADDNDELKTATAQAIADLATGGAQIATGTYTGNGSTSQAITGVGFQPKFLLIIRGSGSTPLSLDGDVAFAIDAQLSEDGRSVIWNSSQSRFDRDTDAITALGADGFTVDDDGADRSPNANGYTYTYVAIG